MWRHCKETVRQQLLLLQLSTNEPHSGNKTCNMSYLNTHQTFLPRLGVVKDRLQTDTHIGYLNLRG